MKKISKTITALVISAVMMLSMGTVYAFEYTTIQPNYEVDDAEYREKVDSLYGYIPFEDMILEALYDTVEGYTAYIETKWYYKHVFMSEPEMNMTVHRSDNLVYNTIPLTADSVFLGEQGRTDYIEEEDGKVRKFNDVHIYWNTVYCKRKTSTEAVNAFLKENGYDVTAVMGGTSGKKFYLQIDENMTFDTMYEIVSKLHEQFGMLPYSFGIEGQKYTLYHDPDYCGYNNHKEYDTKNRDNDYLHILIDKRDHPRVKNKGTFDSGISFEFNPETKVLLVTGEGKLSYEEGQKLSDTFTYYRPADVIIIDKNVDFETKKEYLTRINDDYAEHMTNDYVEVIQVLTRAQYNEFLYVYRDSYADKEDKKHMSGDSFPDKQLLDLFHCINYIDDDIDPYDVLSGKVTLTPENNDKSEFVKYVNEREEMWSHFLEGDADLNGEVGLSDITTISKHYLSPETYPLKNEVAKANADMVNDNIIDMLDVSALIEIELGNGEL